MCFNDTLTIRLILITYGCIHFILIITTLIEERQKEDNLEKSQCTFKPKLITKKFNESNNVNPKFTRVQQKFPNQDYDKDPSAKECTFTPQVKLSLVL